MAFNLPPLSGDTRNAAILDAVRKGRFTVQWATVRSHTADGHTAEFRVFADALKIDGVRINVSAQLAQQIADLLGCSLPTAKLMDLTWLQRTVTLPPFPANTIGVPLTEMDTTAAMVKESAKIDAALAALGNPVGTICTVGKGWVIDNGMVDATGQGKLLNGTPMAVNYGWFFTDTFDGQSFDACASTPNGCRVIQGRGFRHDFKHTDYSQMCLLVSRRCFVDGAERDLHEIFKDPTLAPLASTQGVLKVVRQPGVPLQDPVVAATPCVGPGCPQFVSWTSATTSTSGKLVWMGATLLALGIAGGYVALRHG